MSAPLMLLAALMCALVFALGGGARAQAPIAIRIGFLPGDDNAEPFYAEETGVFKRLGIDAKLDDAVAGREAIERVRNGTLDVGFSNIVSVAREIQGGAPLVLLAAANVYDASAPGSELVQAPSSSYRTGKDLNGKAIASPSGAGSLGALGPMAWIDRTGGDSKTVKLVTGIPLDKLPDALASGQVAAAEMIEPYKTMLLRSGRIKILAPTFNVVARRFEAGGWVASKQWAAANPDAARRFSAAMSETARWANAHHTDTAAILVRRLKIDPAIVAAMNRAMYGEKLDPALIQPGLDVAIKYGVMKPMKAEALIAH